MQSVCHSMLANRKRNDGCQVLYYCPLICHTHLSSNNNTALFPCLENFNKKKCAAVPKKVVIRSNTIL